jgi:hypothetical protein
MQKNRRDPRIVKPINAVALDLTNPARDGLWVPFKMRGRSWS